jgi:hypothetical protein
LTLNPWVVWKDLELVSPWYSIVDQLHLQDVLPGMGMAQSDYLENHYQEIDERTSQLGMVWG